MALIMERVCFNLKRDPTPYLQAQESVTPLATCAVRSEADV